MLKPACLCLCFCLLLAACLQDTGGDRPAVGRRQLALSSDSLAITLSATGPVPGYTSIMVSLENTGDSTERWDIEGGIPHAKPALSYGYLAPKASAQLNFSVENAKYLAGTYPHELKIRYAADSLLTLKVTLIMPENRKLLVSPAGAMLIDYRMDETRITLGNSGNSALRWQAGYDSALLAFSPPSGLLAIGDSIVVKVTALRPPGSGDSVLTPVTIQANDFREYTSACTIQTYLDRKQPLEYILADAEYHRKLDRLITVDSAATSRLRIHALPSGPVREIPLPRQAWCVSVNPAGTLAVAGHEKAFSLINLQSMAVERTFDVGLDVGDILLTTNGWVYMVPRNGQHPPVTGFELATGHEVLSTGGTTSPGATLRLHPSETHLYSSDAIASPQDIRKFDITGGQPIYLHDSPYHGQYITGGLFWLSENGGHLYSSSGSWFRLSENKPDDLEYLGSFAGEGGVSWVEQSLAADRVFLLRRPTSLLHIHAGTTYAPIGKVELADFLEDLGEGKARRVPSEPRMVFSSSDGKRIHVVMRADSPTNQAFRSWAVQTLETSRLP